MMLHGVFDKFIDIYTMILYYERIKPLEQAKRLTKDELLWIASQRLVKKEIKYDLDWIASQRLVKQKILIRLHDICREKIVKELRRFDEEIIAENILFQKQKHKKIYEKARKKEEKDEISLLALQGIVKKRITEEMCKKVYAEARKNAQKDEIRLLISQGIVKKRITEEICKKAYEEARKKAEKDEINLLASRGIIRIVRKQLKKEKKENG